MSREKIIADLVEILRPYGFSGGEKRCGSMGAWICSFESDEFIVTVGEDRGGEGIRIGIGSKRRRKPRAHIRGPWTLSHLRGYIDDRAGHFVFRNANEQIEWLDSNLASLLDSKFLNSDELNRWAVKASRQLFGQDRK